MAGAAADHRTGAGEFDGKLPFVLQTGKIDFAVTAKPQQGVVVAPCDAEIVQASVHVLAGATSASAKIGIGKNANASGLMAFQSLNGVTASTKVNLMTASTWVNPTQKYVSKGDAVYFNVNGASAVGSFAGSITFMPR